MVAITLAAMMLALPAAVAESANLAELRELRVQCLESFSTSQMRLDELRVFVGQQAERERAASSQLFELQQATAAARQTGESLKNAIAQCTNSLQTAQRGIEQASASYKAAVQTLPTGEPWATDGSAALGELRRAAAAAPRDTWKYRRFQQVSAVFADTLLQWRAARRSMEQAAFDLELRAAPTVFKRISNQISSVSAELKTVDRQLAEREDHLNKLTEKSRTWSSAIRELREGEEAARERLAKIRFEFHLVDLDFAAWRLN
jgi:septation ring formation regulator EzrA